MSTLYVFLICMVQHKHVNEVWKYNSSFSSFSGWLIPSITPMMFFWLFDGYVPWYIGMTRVNFLFLLIFFFYTWNKQIHHFRKFIDLFLSGYPVYSFCEIRFKLGIKKICFFFNAGFVSSFMNENMSSSSSDDICVLMLITWDIVAPISELKGSKSSMSCESG